jgi:hypothetical protein
VHRCLRGRLRADSILPLARMVRMNCTREAVVRILDCGLRCQLNWQPKHFEVVRCFEHARSLCRNEAGYRDE